VCFVCWVVVAERDKKNPKRFRLEEKSHEKTQILFVALMVNDLRLKKNRLSAELLHEMNRKASPAVADIRAVDGLDLEDRGVARVAGCCVIVRDQQVVRRVNA
jgi:hypothetical protein